MDRDEGIDAPNRTSSVMKKKKIYKIGGVELGVMRDGRVVGSPTPCCMVRDDHGQRYYHSF